MTQSLNLGNRRKDVKTGDGHCLLKEAMKFSQFKAHQSKCVSYFVVGDTVG